MEKINIEDSFSSDDLAEFAAVLMYCTGPDIYLVQNEKNQNVDALCQEGAGYADAVTGQAFALPPVQSFRTLARCSKS